MRLQSAADAISEADKRSKAIGNLGKAEVRAEQDKRAERMWEPAKGSMEGKGSGEQEGHGGACLFPHQIEPVLAPVLAPALA